MSAPFWIQHRVLFSLSLLLVFAFLLQFVPIGLDSFSFFTSKTLKDFFAAENTLPELPPTKPNPSGEAQEHRIGALFQRAEVFLKTGKLERALEEVRDILNLDIQNERARELLREIFIKQYAERQGTSPSDLEGSLSLPRRGDRGIQEAIEELLRRADGLSQREFYDAAVDELEKVFLLDPLNLEASRRIDRIRDRVIERQKRVWKEQGARLEEDFWVWRQISLLSAEELIREGRFSEARRVFDRLLSFAPDREEIQRSMARLIQKEAREGSMLSEAGKTL